MFIWTTLFAIGLGLGGWLWWKGNDQSDVNKEIGGFLLSIVFGVAFAISLVMTISNYSTAIDYLVEPPVAVTASLDPENIQNVLDNRAREEWIKEAKLQYTKWGVFSFYPSTVMQLKE